MRLGVCQLLEAQELEIAAAPAYGSHVTIDLYEFRNWTDLERELLSMKRGTRQIFRMPSWDENRDILRLQQVLGVVGFNRGWTARALAKTLMDYPGRRLARLGNFQAALGPARELETALSQVLAESILSS